LSADLRRAFRGLARHRGFSALIIGTLAAGTGLAIAVYSVIDGVLVRPLPYRDPSRLVAVWKKYTREQQLPKTFDNYADFADYRENATSFEALGALTWASANHVWRAPSGERRDVLATPASAEFFGVLGARAAMGRTFAASDLNSGCAVVLSDRFWRDSYGADARVLRDGISLDGSPCNVTGVMPREFAFYPAGADMWLLMSPSDSTIARNPMGYPLGIFGRLKPGVTASAAQDELHALYARRTAAIPTEANAAPVIGDLRDDLVWLSGRNLRATLFALGAAVVLVLSVACVNVANLLLARSLTRRREFAVRLSLGAGPSRLVRQVMAEGIALAAAGTGAGVLIAWLVLGVVRRTAPVTLPPGSAPHIDPRVALFAVVLTIATALVFSLIPALRATRTDVTGGLGAPTRGGLSLRDRRASRFLVAAELTLSLVLLAGGALMITSISRLTSAPVGYRVDGVLSLRVKLPRGYDGVRTAQFANALLDDVSGLSGVEGAAVTSSLPVFAGGVYPFTVEGDGKTPAERLSLVSQSAVSAGYFTLFDEPLRAGRMFTAEDRDGAPLVAVVNEALAKQYFGDASPLGKRVRFSETEPWLTIVGVVADEQRSNVLNEMSWAARPALFRALAQRPAQSGYLLVATRGVPEALAEPARAAVLRLERDAVVGDVRTMRARVDQLTEYPRFRAWVVGIFAALALILAAVGLHGVLAQIVAQRTREIGVRIAVGATRIDVVALVLRETAAMTAIGVVAGLGAAFWLTRLVRGMLYGVAPTSPAVLASVVLVLVCTALVASVIPSLRAASIDPAQTLRSD